LALPMRATIEPEERFKDFTRRARFEWRLATEVYSVEATSHALPRCPEPGSLDEFIIEHYWAYSVGRRTDSACLEYEVEHPPWRIRPAENAVFSGDAAVLYGEAFAEVLAGTPDSAFLADGSAVAVRRGRPILGETFRIPVNSGELAASANGRPFCRERPPWRSGSAV
jgi:hypothetical protein